MNRTRHRRILRAMAAGLVVALVGPGCDPGARDGVPTESGAADRGADAGGEKIVKSEQEWRRQLTPEQYRVIRRKGTERAFTGKYWDHRERGVYRCAACGQPLFASGTKFESGTGWPSFWAPVAPGNVSTQPDGSHGMARTEVLCSRCNGHLGHVFDDGPDPTGLRYCINSASLDFAPEGGDEAGEGRR